MKVLKGVGTLSWLSVGGPGKTMHSDIRLQTTRSLAVESAQGDSLRQACRWCVELLTPHSPQRCAFTPGVPGSTAALITDTPPGGRAGVMRAPSQPAALAVEHCFDRASCKIDLLILLLSQQDSRALQIVFPFSLDRKRR